MLIAFEELTPLALGLIGMGILSAIQGVLCLKVKSRMVQCVPLFLILLGFAYAIATYFGVFGTYSAGAISGNQLAAVIVMVVLAVASMGIGLGWFVAWLVKRKKIHGKQIFFVLAIQTAIYLWMFPLRAWVWTTFNIHPNLVMVLFAVVTGAVYWFALAKPISMGYWFVGLMPYYVLIQLNFTNPDGLLNTTFFAGWEAALWLTVWFALLCGIRFLGRKISI